MNTYSAPNFNVDTPNTTITALETLKGSAIAKTDNIYFYGGVTDVMLILDKSFAVNQIIRGRTSAGAASAGSRGGIMVVNNGITVQFQGNANNTLSGFNSNPTTPDASSLGEAIRHDGDYTTVFTNDGDTYNTTKRWTAEVRYGWLNIIKLVMRNSHLAPVANLGCDAARTNNNHLFDRCDVTLAAQPAITLYTVAVNIGIMATRTIVRMQGAGSATVGVIGAAGAASIIQGNGYLDVGDSYVVDTGVNNIFNPIGASVGAGNVYIGRCKISALDIRAGVTIPFYLDKTVVPVTAGTLITVTLSQPLATLMTGLTLKGIACTDRTVTGANTLTFVAPTLTAGTGDVVGSFTGYDNFTITNGITVQLFLKITGIDPSCAFEGIETTVSVSGESFGNTTGEIYLDAIEMDVVSWNDNLIQFTVPDTFNLGTYDLNVIRSDTNNTIFNNAFTVQPSIGSIPNPPEELAVQVLGLTSLNQSWEYIPNTTSFEVYRSLDISGTYSLISTVTTNSNVDINLSSATDYWYKVKSVNAVGTSSFSDPVKGTTLSMEQAGRTFYYPKIIRRTVIALLDMFNDIKIQRYDSNGVLVKTINVPIMFAPQEKFMLLNKRDASTNAALYKNSPIPRIALGLDGISYNSNRAYSTNENIFYDEGLDQNLLTEYVKNVQPAPYDFNFTLYIRTNTFNDYTQIVEQILPYFNPDLYLRIKEFSFLNVERNMQVLLNGTNSEFLEPQTQDDIRLVNGSLNLTVAGWMYRPISSEKIIKKITANYNIIEPEEDILVSKYNIDSLGISGIPYF